MLLAGDLQDGLGHGLGSTGLLQERAGDGAQGDDQTDVRHGAAHAAGEGGEHFLHPHAGDHGKGDGGGDQGEKRMDLELHGTQDQDDNGQDESEYHKYIR